MVSFGCNISSRETKEVACPKKLLLQTLMMRLMWLTASFTNCQNATDYTVVAANFIDPLASPNPAMRNGDRCSSLSTDKLLKIFLFGGDIWNSVFGRRAMAMHQ